MPAALVQGFLRSEKILQTAGTDRPWCRFRGVHQPFEARHVRISIRGHNNRDWTGVPVTRVPGPGIPIAMMPVALMPVSVVVAIVVMIVAPVRLSVMAER